MEKEEENGVRIQKQSPPFIEIMLQTVYQHESQITVWLLASQHSFIVFSTNPTVSSCHLDQHLQYYVMSAITTVHAAV